MQNSSAPGKIVAPFANSGGKTTIPVASQTGIEDGRASFTDGFPPLTRTPLSAGGVPPFGTDMNGILFAITALQQWQSAGGGYSFDAAFAASINGYPKGALLLKSDFSGFWQSTVEGNTSNPDTGGAGWKDMNSGKLLNIRIFSTPGTFPYTETPGTKSVDVRLQAGGGAGGAAAATTSSQASAGAGGAAGGYAQSYLKTGFSGVSIVVGAGGTNGANGGNSSFGSLLSATGGNAAPAGLAANSFPIQQVANPGGVGNGGNVMNVTGDSGWPMLITGVGNGISGKGGASFISNATRQVVGNSNGVDGQYGSGGSGAISQGGNGAQIGGFGGDGIVIVYEYA